MGFELPVNIRMLSGDAGQSNREGLDIQVTLSSIIEFESSGRFGFGLVIRRRPLFISRDRTQWDWNFDESIDQSSVRSVHKAKTDLLKDKSRAGLFGTTGIGSPSTLPPGWKAFSRKDSSVERQPGFSLPRLNGF